MKPNILAIDDNSDILTALRICLSQNGFSVTTDTSPDRIPVLMKKTDFSVILLDMNFSKGAILGHEGFKWLDIILDINPQTVVILMTAYGDIELAVKAMQSGASDFIQKPWDNQKLLSTISMATELNTEKRKRSISEVQNRIINSDFKEIIGQSSSMEAVFNIINRVAVTDVNVLIRGENGTGKDLIARAIHNRSKRIDSQFIPVDMGAIPESLFESEMFGFVKGAFTGADKKRMGRIEAASGGTLFLDEIGNVPGLLQSKLLRVLESGEVSPLGSESLKEVDVRLICATNCNIESMVGNGDFRQDLLYRINTVEIILPPLRERKVDIPLLLNHFLSIYCKKYNKDQVTISDSALLELKNYVWPGNVRELSNVVERAVILSSSSILKPEDFSISSNNDNLPINGCFNLDKMESKVIGEVIDRENGNLSRAAQILGITRATLYRKIKKYDL